MNSRRKGLVASLTKPFLRDGFRLKIISRHPSQMDIKVFILLSYHSAQKHTFLWRFRYCHDSVIWFCQSSCVRRMNDVRRSDSKRRIFTISVEFHITRSRRWHKHDIASIAKHWLFIFCYRSEQRRWISLLSGESPHTIAERATMIMMQNQMVHILEMGFSSRTAPLAMGGIKILMMQKLHGG